MNQILSIGFVGVPGRIAVPGNVGCDVGLEEAKIEPSCTTCAKYYDPRPEYGNNPNGECVYVPSQEKCFPKNWARLENYEIGDCGEFRIY